MRGVQVYLGVQVQQAVVVQLVREDVQVLKVLLEFKGMLALLDPQGVLVMVAQVQQAAWV